MTIALNLSAYDLTNTVAVDRLKSVIKSAVSTYPALPYLFAPTDSAMGWKMFAIPGADELAVKQFRVYMKTEVRDLLAAGIKPKIAFDSYLYAGGQVRDLALTLDWCGHLLTAEEITEAKLFINQVAFNLANYSKSNWGGIPDIYDDGILDNYNGWARNDPLNNYFYSHLNVFVYAYLVNPTPINRAYLDARLELLIKLWSAWDKGSPEGTGYGLALASLFQIIRVLSESAGTEFPVITSLAEKTIEFWFHCSIRDYKSGKFAEIIPLMDHSRISRHFIDDPDRSLILNARALPISLMYKDMATAWLGEISHTKMRLASNCHVDLLDHGKTKYFPVETSYLANSSGHYLWRSNWTKDATVASYACGANDQAHDQDDQASFQLAHKGYWQAVTGSMMSKSGILNDPQHHNGLCFYLNGVPVRQSTKNKCVMTVVSPQEIFMDVSPAYIGIQHTRRCSQFYNGIVIEDNFTAGSAEAVSQIHTPYLPVVDGNKITAGMTTWMVEVPATPAITIVDRKTICPADDLWTGYRIEIRGGTSKHRVIGVIDTAMTPIELPGAPTPTPSEPTMPDHINTVVPKFAAPWIHIAKRGSDTRHGQSWHWQGLTEWIETKDLRLDDLVATCRLSADGLTCGGVAGVGTGVAADNRVWWSVLHLAPEQQVHCATAKPANLTDKNGAAAAISVYLKSIPGEPPQEEDPVPGPEIEVLRAKVLQLEGEVDALQGRIVQGDLRVIELMDEVKTLKATEAQSQEVIAGLRKELDEAHSDLKTLSEELLEKDRYSLEQQIKIETFEANIRAFRDAQQKLFAGVE
jgi:hypothetical protein